MSNDPKLNIYEKLSKIREMVSVIQKSKQAYGYKYVTEDEILAKVTAGMKKYDVSLIPSVKSDSLSTEKYQYVDKKGKDVYEILLQADMEFKWVNNENPEEFIIVPWILAGQQSDVSMAFGSALSYSNRYFLLKYFQIATVDDDPDNWRNKQKLAEKEEELLQLKEVQNNILKNSQLKIEQGIDREIVYKIISDNNDGKKNPNSIKDINVAKKVLEEITNLNEKGRKNNG